MLSARHLATLALISLPLTSHALEYPIGTPQHLHGMEIAAVYLQPVEMEPAGMMTALDAVSSLMKSKEA